jgi:hypothetical protein
MWAYLENDGRYPDDSIVEVRFPLTQAQSEGPRELCPWVRGTVIGQGDRNEWHVVMDGEESLGEEENGEIYYPACFRGLTEIRRVVHHRPA